MRNPIQPTPDRPIPLPDCILMDGWWTVERRGGRADGEGAFRVIAGRIDSDSGEGTLERHRGDAE